MKPNRLKCTNSRQLSTKHPSRWVRKGKKIRKIMTHHLVSVVLDDTSNTTSTILSKHISPSPFNPNMSTRASTKCNYT